MVPIKSKLLGHLLFALVLVGCSNQPNSVPSPTPITSPSVSAIKPTATSVPATIPTAKPTVTSTQSGGEVVFSLSEKRQADLVFKSNYTIKLAKTSGLTEVTNTEYGFSFQYPSGLELLTSANSVTINWEEQRLLITFRKPNEYQLGRTGVPEGEIVAGGEVNFAGNTIPRRVLVSNGLDMAVLYKGGAEFEVDRIVGGSSTGKLFFSINLDTTAPYYKKGYVYNGIPSEVQDVADQIVSSFAFFGRLP